MTDRTHPDSGRIITSSDILLRDAETALMYEELRAAIDGGHESMTHADALAEIAAIRAENEQLQAQLASIGAGGVSGPLIGRAFDAHDMATASAEGFREGAAEIAKLRGQRAVLCSLLRECMPVIDALMQMPGDDDSDAHLNGLAGRITGALNALAEDQVKGGES